MLKEPAAPDDDDRFIVTVVRTGGIAGLRRQWEVVPPRDEEPHWIELIYRCPWQDPAPTESGADRYVWRIQARPPGARLEQTLPESALEGAWRQLVEAVRAAAAS
ncbi:protealysin inhibitor emfourin [Microbacterium sp.]|uniref:protealysin inhibitor emfourin n=1 Tax=Microbacterium sp. TaxID=51671 RepID=UPI003A8CC7D5